MKIEIRKSVNVHLLKKSHFSENRSLGYLMERTGKPHIYWSRWRKCWVMLEPV